MVILIRKRKIHVLTLFLCMFGSMAAILWSGRQVHLTAMENTLLPEKRLYILDAGHGGEDGGAVAADGTKESGINLAIALRLNTLLRFCGQNTELIRAEDISVHSQEAKTFREKKASDLKNRVELVNARGNAVLISIHQNALPSVPSVHGAQAFYNRCAGSDILAEQIQIALNAAINTGNEKKKREIPAGIYLMNHVDAPAVLVECGFLSNAEETGRLQTPQHQIRLATAILSGILTEPAV